MNVGLASLTYIWRSGNFISKHQLFETEHKVTFDLVEYNLSSFDMLQIYLYLASRQFSGKRNRLNVRTETKNFIYIQFERSVTFSIELVFLRWKLPFINQSFT